MILLDAIYINNSGGKVLLDQLVKGLYDSGAPVFYLLDKRVEGSYPYLRNTDVLYLNASVKDRNRFYREHIDSYTKVICFGNIPPAYKLQAEVYTYFHQFLYLEVPKGTPILKKIFSLLKSAYVKSKKNNTDFWIVQTSYGKILLADKYKIDKNLILEYPFYIEPEQAFSTDKAYNEFLFVSDGNPHKNHHKLLKAWELVNTRHPDWVLHLTVSNNYPELVTYINELRMKGVNVVNHGILTKSELAGLYKRAGFFLFPSLTESLGLPLVEASIYQCKILGANRDYLKAVIQPSDFFDPESSENMASVIMKNAEKAKECPNPALKLSNMLDLLIKKITG